MTQKSSKSQDFQFEWVFTEDVPEDVDHLHPVLNYTKWNELRLAMHALPFHVSFRFKVLGMNWVTNWDADWLHHFRWGGDVTRKSGVRFLYVHDQSRNLYDIEWAELHFDEANIGQVLATLAGLSIPYEPSDNGLKVFGHIDDTGRLTVAKA